MIPQLYINTGSFFTDGIFDPTSQYIILVTGILKEGEKKGQYSLRYVAVSSKKLHVFPKVTWSENYFFQRISDQYATNFKNTYGYPYSDHLSPIEPSKLVLYIHWPVKLDIFHNILSGQYKRLKEHAL